MTEATDKNHTLQHRISRECVVRLYFVGPVTQEAIQRLQELLEAQQDTFPMQSELDTELKGEQPTN